MIKPLLENKMKNNKDLLAFHMLNGCNDELLEKINQLLKLSGKEADNTNAKSIVENAHEKEEVTKKKNIVKNIQNIQKETPQPPINKLKNIGPNNALYMENDGLRKENDNFKAKLKQIESELKSLRAENAKLKGENTSELQEKIKKKDAEIEKLKIMDKDRIAIISELEQKNKLNTPSLGDLLVMLSLSDKKIEELLPSYIEEQMDRQIFWILQEIPEFEKLINSSEVDDIRAKICFKCGLTGQQLLLFYYYFMNKIIYGECDSLKKFAEKVDQNYCCLTETEIDKHRIEINKILKIDNFEDIFDKFKTEYSKRDESFNFLLNDKTKEFNEFINKFVEKAQTDVKNVFNNVNTPTSDVKDKKIEWLSKQVDELTDYKNKIIEYENKFKDLNSKKEAEDKKYMENSKLFEDLNEKMKTKNATYEKIEKDYIYVYVNFYRCKPK